MKKMHEDQQSDNGPAPEMKTAKSEVFSSHDFFPTLISQNISIQHFFSHCAKIGSPLDRSFSLLHPPGNIRYV